MVIIELYFQQNYNCSAKIKSVPYAMFSEQQVLNFLDMGGGGGVRSTMTPSILSMRQHGQN